MNKRPHSRKSKNHQGHSQNTAGAEVRAAAAKAAAAVDQGQSLDVALATQHVAPRDQALLREMATGVVRHRRHLDAEIAGYLDRPLPKKAVVLQALLRVGLYQLREMRLPDHAAVHATVAATSLIGATKARGMVNAVLRRSQREATLSAEKEWPIGVQTSHPDWMVQKFRQDWPNKSSDEASANTNLNWRDLLKANNRRAPMTLRVALDRISLVDAQEKLAAAEIKAEPHPLVDSALVLDVPCAVADLSGFAEGWLSVQDAAAQLAVQLLEPKAGESVLDACAAPGGKTGHLLEFADNLNVTAIDADPDRLEQVADNMGRLDRNAKLEAGDVREFISDQCYDRILLDAPCSGIGVIRRHPDIKWLRRETDIPVLAAQQLSLLQALWPAVKPGGRLLYAVCSVFSEEGEAVVAEFSREQKGVSVVPISATWGEGSTHGRRIATGEHGMDGFYYALLERAAG